MNSKESELMAEGLHPKDVVWLENRINSLEAALQEWLCPIHAGTDDDCIDDECVFVRTVLANTQ